MLRGFRRLPFADRFAIAYILLYLGWLALRTPGTRLSVIIGTLASYPLGLVVAWANFRNARVALLDRRTRVAWLLLGCSALSLWTSGSAWTFYLAFVAPEPWPAWVGHLEFAQHLFALGGYLAFPGAWPPANRRTRVLFDISMTVVAGFVLACLLGARAVLTQSGLVWGYTAISWGTDWVLFVVASVGVLQKRDVTTRKVMGFLLAANTAYIVANYGLSAVAAYHSGDSLDGLWFVAWVLRWSAARVAWHRYHTASAAQLAAEGAAERPRARVFSYVMVAGAFMLLVTQVISGDRRFLGVLAVSAMSMAALLVLRQLTELRENRRLFAAQLAQDARFRLLIQGSSDVVLVIGDDRRISYVSPSAERLYGEGCALRVGGRLEDVVVPDDRPLLDDLFGEPTRGPGREARPLQVRAQPGDARREIEVVWSDLRLDPVVRGIVLNCRDVTERNELERQLRHAQRLDEVGQLAGGLAHDFNNVLTAIRGYSELLRIDLGNPERAREDLAHVEEAVDRAASVTRKLLALSRNQPVKRRPIDLNGVCGELLPLLRQLLTDRIEVSFHPAAGLWPVMADQGQVEQVLLNLATNARDAMADGGRLRIVTANRRVSDAAPFGRLAAGDYAAILVSDEGCGMAPEVRARIFEPFFSTKGRERGMGLGLAMVMGIVTDSGGEIGVESRPGHGSTFTILLPRTLAPAGDAPAPAAALAPVAPEKDARTVLLVDDETAVRTIARRMLTRQGYQVIEAESGQAAVAVASDAQVRIDLLLTDLVMPGLHGRELVARFHASRPGVPVVCMTGFAGDGDEAQGLCDTAAFVVSKPFSSDELLRNVRDALAAGAPAPECLAG